MMMEKKLIFGIGTGRCGTVSLCTLLNNQQSSNFTHEQKPLIAWDGSKKILDGRIKKILSREDTYVGDVAFFYLPYVQYILEHYPGTKIICLEREKREVVRSYMKKTRGRNHWTEHRGLFWRHCEWDQCYPKYNAILKRSAIKQYWDDYYTSVHSLKKKYPEFIIIMDMNEALNTRPGVEKVLNFIGISEKNFVIKKGIKKNAIGS